MIVKRKEYIILKKLTICLMTMLFLLMITISAQAEVSKDKGDLTVLAGNKSLVQGSYQLTDKLKLNGDMAEEYSYLEELNDNQKDYFLRTDLHYQATDWLGIKVGGRYDSEPNETIPYGGFDFFAPFGTNNLKVTGYYDYNYQGKEWASYEWAWRIEMYQNQFLYAGVRGDNGDGFKSYSYNLDNDPLFFLQGDFSWQLGKFGINFRPLLYATGYILTDTTLKYNWHDRTNIVLNISDFYDNDLKYRLGLQYKF
jgi:hypothetical protein